GGGGGDPGGARPSVGAPGGAGVGGGGAPGGGGLVSTELVQINGAPALVIRIDGVLDSVVATRIDDGSITGLYVVRNPEKLSRIEQTTAVTR
ncbi:RNA polymerase subunit sigma-24, partial [Nocardia sp. NPDC058497]